MNMFETMSKDEKIIINLMNETYATHRAFINDPNRNLIILTTVWTFLKTTSCLIKHSERLLGKDILYMQTSYLENDLKHLRQYLKEFKYKTGTDKKIANLITESKEACFITDSQKPNSIVPFLILVQYFKEDLNFFIKLLSVSTHNIIICLYETFVLIINIIYFLKIIFQIDVTDAKLPDYVDSPSPVLLVRGIYWTNIYIYL